MKKLFVLIALLVIAVSTFAQTPQGFNYQAIYRDVSGNILPYESVAVIISIYQGTFDGPLVFTEAHTGTTNKFGLISITIGSVNTSGFSTIDWSDGPYFIEVNINGNPMGVTQLLSVPYAMHSLTAESVTGGISESDPVFAASTAAGIDQADIDNWDESYSWGDHSGAGYATKDMQSEKITNLADPTEDQDAATKKYVDENAGGSGSFYLGQDTLGGIVFYIYLDQNGEQHGLIVSKTETTAQWQSTTSITNATRSWDGEYNMDLLSDSPAKDWITASFSADWYLPSIDELSILWHNRFHANKALNDAGATLLSNIADYWSSTETGETAVLIFTFNGGRLATYNKLLTYTVRAVRAF